MSQETNDFTKLALIEASRQGARMFRQNVGQAYVGEVVSREPKLLVLRNWRPFHAGLVVGSSDIIGPTREGLFGALEVKLGQDRLTTEQRTFLQMVRNLGGRAGVVRRLEDVAAILGGEAPPLDR